MTREPFPAFDLYAELEVSRLASVEVIEAAYRTLAKSHHPDVARPQDSERIKRLNLAREWLADPVRRRRYDAATRPELSAPNGPKTAGARRTAPEGVERSPWTSTTKAFGPNTDEVRQFLADLRALDERRALAIRDGRASIDPIAYGVARHVAYLEGRTARQDEWLLAREAASVIARGKLGDSPLAPVVSDVVADISGAITVRDLIPRNDFDVLLQPWTWRGGPPAVAAAARAAGVPVPSIVPVPPIVPAEPTTHPAQGGRSDRPEASPRAGPAPKPTRTARAKAAPRVSPTAAAPAVSAGRAGPAGPASAASASAAAAASAVPAGPAASAASAASAVPTVSAASAGPGSRGSHEAAAAAPIALTIRGGRVRPGRRGASMLASPPAVLAMVGLIALASVLLALGDARPEVAVVPGTNSPTAAPSFPPPTLGASPPATAPAIPSPSVATSSFVIVPSDTSVPEPSTAPGPGSTPSVTARPPATLRPTPVPTPRPTPVPTPAPTPTPTPVPTPSPPVFCGVVNLLNVNSSNAQLAWNTAGFTGTVIFSPSIPPQYKIGWQSLTAGETVPCTSDISVQEFAP